MTCALPGESLTEAIEREMAGARPEAAADWFLHPVLAGLGDGTAAEIAALAGAGHTSLKVFLSDPGQAAGTPGLAEAITAAGRAGCLTLIHCEDAGMLARAGRELVESGRGAMRHFPDSRTVGAEVAAVDQAIDLARRTGAPVYIVHLSSAAALDRCRRARSAGLPVHVETRPLYLHLTRERFDEPDAGKYVGAPPLRERADRDALWRGLAAGDVDTVCSDHAPWTLAAKLDPALDVVTARQGVADLETLMPMLFSEGVVTGRISLARFVELTSARAARLFGLYPRKGAIAVGSDADLALWDPQESRVIDGSRMSSRAGYSVYDGWRVQGWPRFVLRRGQLVLAEGECLAKPGQGRWLRRDGGAAGALYNVTCFRNVVTITIRRRGNPCDVPPFRRRGHDRDGRRQGQRAVAGHARPAQRRVRPGRGRPGRRGADRARRGVLGRLRPGHAAGWRARCAGDGTVRLRAGGQAAGVPRAGGGRLRRSCHRDGPVPGGVG
jgi:dihydropyrimidinase